MSLNGKQCSSNEEESCVAKRPKIDNCSSLLNPIFYEEQFKREFREAYRSEKDYVAGGGEAVFNNSPFQHCVLRNVIKDANYLENLKSELLGLQFNMKSNDLYKFYQSNDLKTSNSENISQFRKLLYGDCLNWIKHVTDIPLDSTTIDMSCAKYNNTDVLLCHDDELEGRRIAYIFYLVSPDWCKNDGGSLDLFSTDEHGQPYEIVKSLVPLWNSLVFFEVTPKSFHQVSEILSDQTRLSVSGWFHGPSVVRPSPFKELPPFKEQPLRLKDEVLVSWINPMYLQTEIVEDIRHSFEDNSEVELQDFLLEDKYKDLLKQLSTSDVTWRTRGPANKRHYETTSSPSCGVVQECLELFKSEPMFRLLTTLTGLKLSDVDIEEEEEEEGMKRREGCKEEKDCEEETRKKSEQSTDENEASSTGTTYCCHGDIRRWSHGSYTLIHDTDPEASQMALDAMFYIGSDAWQEEFGGYTSYLAREEDEELLTVHPCSNSLALVYRDTETLKFVKHINSQCKRQKAGSSTETTSQHYYNFMFTYFE